MMPDICLKWSVYPDCAFYIILQIGDVFLHNIRQNKFILIHNIWQAAVIIFCNIWEIEYVALHDA